MFIYVMMYVYLCNGVCLFIGVCFLVVCTMYESIWEADFVVEDQIRLKMTRGTLLIKASGFSLCISDCTQIMHIIIFTFGYLQKLDGFC
jgi:predicted histidine transporter YuiF (NhaC family)